MSERLYTLQQAQLELGQRECAEHGHDFRILLNGTGAPSDLVCTRCGSSWAIAEAKLLITGLAAKYREGNTSEKRLIAELCDDWLDPQGALLGRVREEAMKDKL